MKYYFTLALFLFVPLFTLQGQVLINEIQAKNQEFITDPDYNEFVDWVELYNSGDQQVDISGWSLNDTLGENSSWAIPSVTILQPGDFFLIWLDNKGVGRHANFSLKSEGERILLMDAQGQMIDSITFQTQQADISFGRIPETENQWGYFYTPTPGEENSSTPLSQLMADVEFSHEEGFYNQYIELILTSSTPGAKIKYTVDGSSPDLNSINYTDPIRIFSPTVVRASALVNEVLPIKDQSRIFIVNRPQTGLPVISLSTDPANLWDNTTGIYITGTNGIKGNGPDTDPPRNWNQDWERPAEMTFFDENGELQIKQRIGIKVSGGWSRANAQKSLSLFARKKYGKGSIDYQFFPEKNIHKFETVTLRNSGNDWSGNGGTMLRDAVMQAIAVGKMDVDYQGYYPAELYLNGQYWGIHNIREKLNEHYAASNRNENSDAIDVLEGNARVNNGSDKDYLEMINWLESNNLSSQTNYEYASSIIDIPHFIDYQIIQIFIDNRDWPGNNIKFWKPWRQGGKWRWILFDTDFGFSIWGQSPSDNTIRYAREPNGPGWPNPPWSTLILRKLLENNKFQKAFTERFNHHLNTTFQSDRVISIIDSIQNKIEPSIQKHLQTWGGHSVDSWRSKVETMRTYAKNRPNYVKQHLRSEFALSNPISTYVYNPTPDQGYLTLDRKKVFQDIEGVWYPEMPASLSAFPASGKRFLHWEVGSNQNLTIIQKGEVWKYWDAVANPVGDWKQESFDDSAWLEGNAQLGYGDGDENTVIDFGLDPSNKIPSAYFRKSFTLTNKDQLNDFVIDLLMDDGAVVYVNGIEVIRANMPDSPINRSTYAVNGISDNTEESYEINESSFVEGLNTIAVEIHQINATSSDLSFNLALHAVENQSSTSTISTQDLTLPLSSSAIITPIFADALPILTEIFYHPDQNQKAGFIEICNPSKSTFDLSNYTIEGVDFTFPQGTTLPSDECLIITNKQSDYQNQGYQVFEWMAGDLESNGESLLLKNDLGELIDSVFYLDHSPWPETELGHSIELRHISTDNMLGENWQINSELGGSSGVFQSKSITKGIYINEVMSNNESNLLTTKGKQEDWIEIYNDNDFSVNLGGMYFSDKEDNLTKWQIPANEPIKTTIQAKGHLLFWADGQPEEGPRHLDLNLKSAGEFLAISEEGGLIIDSIHIPELVLNESYGRSEDGSEELIHFPIYSTTPRFDNNSANTAPKITSTPILEINPNQHYTYNIEIEDNVKENVRIHPECIPQWLTFVDFKNGTGRISGAIRQSHIGKHIISFYVEDGMLNSSDRQTYILEVLDPISQRAKTLDKGFFFPNPSNDTFHYIKKADQGSSFAFEIFDLSGRKLLTKEAVNDSEVFRTQINLGDLVRGMYIVRVSINGEIEETHKLIRE